MIDLEIQITGTKLDRFFDLLHGKLPQAWAKAALRGAQHAAGVLREEAPARRGRLRRSFRARLIETNTKGAKAEAVSALVYAGIVDRGGTIKGKPWLAIPFPGSSGTKTKWARDWPRGSLQFIRSRAGNLLLAQIKKNKIVPKYILKKQVTLPANRFVDRAETKSRSDIEAIMAEAYRSAVESARGGST